MSVSKKSLCILTHYSELPKIPYYVEIYANELSNYFDNVIIAANQRSFTQIENNINANVTIRLFKNEGYDLGLFHKVFQTLNLEDFYQIACVNDSNFLFNKLRPIFDWGKRHENDFWGLIDSNEKPWFSTHKENYHIQSYFVVFNENAIKELPLFFETIDIHFIINQTETKQLRRMVIDKWEIGLTQFLLNKGLKCNTFINSESFLKAHKSTAKNISHSHYKELVESGYPMIKKKVVVMSGWRSFCGMHEPWEKLLLKYGCTDWNIPLLINDIKKAI